MVGSFNVDRFYSDLLDALGAHALKGGTAIGAAVVLKRVALAHGIDMADRLPLPRPTRTEREDLAWEKRRGAR